MKDDLNSWKHAKFIWQQLYCGIKLQIQAEPLQKVVPQLETVLNQNFDRNFTSDWLLEQTEQMQTHYRPSVSYNSPPGQR